MKTVLEQRVPLYDEKKINFDEYIKLPDDGFQYEIVEGVMKNLILLLKYSHQVQSV